MRDFPFGLAVLLAVLFHVLLGLGLRHNFLLVGSPAAPARHNEPLSIRIVDVPSGGPTLEKPPNTRNFSDANRKAGPLEKTIRTERPVVQAERPAARAAAPSRPPGPARNAAQSPVPQQAMKSPPAPLPPIQDPSTISSNGDIPIGDSQGKEKLSKSLQNLDQFITPGGGTGGTDSGGDPLQGDPGSGVYFDTRGFDLGPWANQVIAIVKRNWLIPVAAEMGMKGVVGVAFEVQRSGEITNVRLVSSSKIPSFDQAAMNALKSSSPFPPLPVDFPRPLLPGVFRFYYNTPVPAN
jgi:protein TonB